MELLSVIYEPVNRTNLLRALSRSGVRTEAGKAHTQETLRPLLSSLAGRGLVEVGDRGVQCAPLLAEPLTRRAVREGRFASLTRQVRELDPVGSAWGSYYYYRSRTQALRELRLALYDGDWPLVQKHLQAIQHSYSNSLALINPLSRIIGDAFDAAWAATLPPELLHPALIQILGDAADHFTPQPEAPAPQQSLKILAEIMRLRRACCNPRLVAPEAELPNAKLEAFGELVDELREGGHKALVFSQFTDHLAILRAWLEKNGVVYQYLDGSTPPAERQRAVAAFQSGQGELFLISLKAGGTGLNLTAADTVIHMDPWWNPALEDQASGRAHRMGQERPVMVYRLVSQGTIEQKIVDLHCTKRDLADSLLEGTDAGGRLSPEELLALLSEG